MNVTVENLAPCKKLVRIEIEAKEVDETFASVTKDYQKQAALPGFRPGKAPRDLVIKKYELDINEEVKRKLTSDSYRKALEEKKLDVLAIPTSRKSSSAAANPSSMPPPSRPRRNLNCLTTRASPPSRKCAPSPKTT